MPPLPPPSDDLMNARYCELSALPTSPLCRDLCNTLLGKMLHQSKHRPNQAKQRAFAAFIAELLDRDPQDHGGWLYRVLSPNGFTGGAVGYRPFYGLLRPMSVLMIEFIPGTRQYAVSELTGGKRQPTWGRGARFRATDWLRSWFAEHGIIRETWGDHFTRQRPKTLPRQSSLVLRAMKRTTRGRSEGGQPMPVDRKHPKVTAIKERMDRLNSFLWDQVIEPYGPAFLRRIFANGDQPGFCWETGGRLTALGTETFQTAKKADRASILINGQDTVEIDIRASHLIILVGRGHLPEDLLHRDPYVVEGIPRDLVKSWVTMTLGYGKRHKRWPRGVKAAFMDKHGVDLSREFPLGATGDTILSKLPILGTEGLVAPLDWGPLQFLESEAVMKAMEVLAYDHQVASLPVHDSLIVPKERKELATAILKASFKEIVGVEPMVHLE